MSFLDWFSDPDTAAERREIMQLLRVTEAEAVKHQEIARLAEALEIVGMEMMAPMTGGEDEEEDG